MTPEPITLITRTTKALRLISEAINDLSRIDGLLNDEDNETVEIALADLRTAHDWLVEEE
jgi:hypothetical protein